MLLFVLLLYVSSSFVSSSCPSNGITVSVLIIPPYVQQSTASNGSGIAYDFVEQSLLKCFRSCNLPPVKWNFVNSSKVLRDVVLAKKTDLAFPIVPSLEQDIEQGELELMLQSNYGFSGNVTFVFDSLIGSPGLSFIVHTESFNSKARQHIVDGLLQIWPIVVLCLLLAGMSGIFVWALVSSADFLSLHILDSFSFGQF